MMADEWEFTKTTGKCAKTERELTEGESYYAVLIENPDTFERRDYSLEAWEGPPEGSFCHWRGKIPIREKKQSTIAVDMEILIQIFIRLEDEKSPTKQRFRFMLALLLMRKRLLKLEQTIKEDKHEYWVMRLTTDQNHYRVLNPQLNNEQIEQLSRQLTIFLGGNVETVESLDESDDTQAAEPHEETLSENQPPADAVSTEREDAGAAS